MVNRQRERSQPGRHEGAVKPAGEEGIAFNRGSQLYEVNLSGKRTERLHKVEVRFENIHGKREIGYHSEL
jgi:hypothetical protein